MGGGGSKKKYEPDDTSENVSSERGSTRLSHPLALSPKINKEVVETKETKNVKRLTVKARSVSGRGIFDPDKLDVSFLRREHNIDVKGEPVSDMYRFGDEMIGSGLFGVICAAYDRREDGEDGTLSTKPAALVKTISKEVLKDKNSFERVMMEVVLVKALAHDNILKMTDFYDNMESYHMVMEAVQAKDLFFWIIENDHLYEDTARNVMRQILRALSYLHGRKIIHRDLKPENLLIAADGTVKISDLSLALRLKPGESIFSPYGFTGTPGYCAPEVLRGEQYGFGADMFSAGVIMYILLGGYPPFPISEDTTSYPETAQGVPLHRFDSPFFDNVSADAKLVMDRLMNKQPEERGDPESVMGSPWWKMELDKTSLDDGFVKLKEWNSKRSFKTTARSVQSAIKIASAISKKGFSPSAVSGRKTSAFGPGAAAGVGGDGAGVVGDIPGYVRLRSFSAEASKEAIEKETVENEKDRATEEREGGEVGGGSSLPAPPPTFSHVTFVTRESTTVEQLSTILGSPPTTSTPCDGSDVPVTHSWCFSSINFFLHQLPPSSPSPTLYTDPVFGAPASAFPPANPAWSFDDDIPQPSPGVSDPYVSEVGIAVADPREAHEEVSNLGQPCSPLSGYYCSFTTPYPDPSSPVSLRFLPSPPSASLPAPPPLSPHAFDHIVLNVESLAPAIESISQLWPTSSLQPLSTFASFSPSSVGTSRSSLASVVLHPLSSRLLLPLNEPVLDTPVRSQISTFLHHNGGHPGIQHLAVKCEDVVGTVARLRGEGVAFIPPPPADYYDSVFSDPRAEGLGEGLRERVQREGILVDFEKTPGTGEEGVLLQIFTAPLNPERPGLFFELIQRIGCRPDTVGCGGFGTGNFKRLFEAIEKMEAGN
ncbi:hypothetical protein TeGR_g12107 [Tetraparma gracilis]|uniref:4-hydroxyphenylpyruvate dioxygenase n=1 Tax=Tetraparma gracilis TaxID=2962635 RepID=A0ABQ6M562_9STRA|nr:hypothetical protein TeGR_g12107 [Tetraparma gracilis]